jgi:hypothetical protein
MMQDSTMAILGEFNVIADIKAVQKNSSTGRETFSVEQTFIGNYKLDTTEAINRGPIYIRPHINVTKEVLKQDETTALFGINLTNDGNKTLGLPDGLTFINSSLLPDIVGKEIRWSIPCSRSEASYR